MHAIRNHCINEDPRATAPKRKRPTGGSPTSRSKRLGWNGPYRIASRDLADPGSRGRASRVFDFKGEWWSRRGSNPGAVFDSAGPFRCFGGCKETAAASHAPIPLARALGSGIVAYTLRAAAITAPDGLGHCVHVRPHVAHRPPGSTPVAGARGDANLRVVAPQGAARSGVEQADRRHRLGNSTRRNQHLRAVPFVR
jgi:hypothetical protein